MTLDEAIEMYTSNAKYERTHGNLQGCLEFRQLADWLKELKQLRDQLRWIPVSERLPEEGESVLTQAMFKDDMKMCVSSRIDWNYWTGWGTRNINIIAWMPLPEPYEPQESEEV